MGKREKRLAGRSREQCKERRVAVLYGDGSASLMGALYGALIGGVDGCSLEWICRDVRKQEEI